MRILQKLGLKTIRKPRMIVSESEAVAARSNDAEKAFTDRFENMTPSKEPSPFGAMVESATPEKLDSIERDERKAADTQSQRDAKRRRKLVRDEHVSARVTKSVKELLIDVAKGAGKRTAADGIHIIAEYYAKQHGIDLQLGGDQDA